MVIQRKCIGRERWMFAPYSQYFPTAQKMEPMQSRYHCRLFPPLVNKSPCSRGMMSVLRWQKTGTEATESSSFLKIERSKSTYRSQGNPKNKRNRNASLFYLEQFESCDRAGALSTSTFLVLNLYFFFNFN